MRALGHNQTVGFLQFMKGSKNYGEVKIASVLPNFTLVQSGQESFVSYENPDPPGTGDGIQAIKAGIMEVADVFVINKSDMPGADRMKGDIEMMLNLSCDGKTWRPPVVLTSVINETGVDTLFEKIEAHQAYMLESGQKDVRRMYENCKVFERK